MDVFSREGALFTAGLLDYYSRRNIVGYSLGTTRTVLMVNVSDVRACNRPARLNSFRPKELVCLQSRQPYDNGTAKFIKNRRGKRQQSDNKHLPDYTLSMASSYEQTLSKHSIPHLGQSTRAGYGRV